MMIQSVERDQVPLPTDGRGDGATCSMRDGLAEPCYQFATRTLARDLKPPTPRIEKDSVLPQIQEKGLVSNTVLRTGRKPDTQPASFALEIQERSELKHY